MINKSNIKILCAFILVLILFTGCNNSSEGSTPKITASATNSSNSSQTQTSAPSSTADNNSQSDSNTSQESSDRFTERDLKQEADLNNAKSVTLTSNKDVNIKEEGVYVVSGTATETTIFVEAADEAKVQIVLDNASITNNDSPAIYVKSGDKVFVTTTKSTSTLKVTGNFVTDGETNLDAVIFSKSDLVLNGVGTLNVNCSAGNGITSKDGLKVTGGTYLLTTALDSMEANDYVSICDGNFTIETKKDGIHCENSDDQTVGDIYISGGTFKITASEDGIQGTTIVQIDGGTIDIPTCAEGIEGTYVKINGGKINIYSTDDGINASNKSSKYEVVIEFNGGDTTISMGSGDVDAVDANGSIYVNDGKINITSERSSFDYDVKAELNGGTVIINGTQVSEIPQSMMGGGGGGGRGGRNNRFW